MQSEFIVFRDFSDRLEADRIAEIFEQEGIKTQIEQTKAQFDVSFVNTSQSNNIFLKINNSDFEKAEALLLENSEEINIEDFPKDYYLFSFDDNALFDILLNAEEWGDIDYQLAKKLLEQRGKPVEGEYLISLKKEKLATLAMPEKSQQMVLGGYLFGLLGGLIGFFMGYLLYFEKKKLPNGQRVHKYVEAHRKHGLIIMCIGAVFFIIALSMKMQN